MAPRKHRRGRRLPFTVLGLVCVLTMTIVVLGFHASSSENPPTDPVTESAPASSAPSDADEPGLPSAGAPLTPGWNGPKVALVQQVVGTWEDGHEATMDEETVDAVKQWQMVHGLQPTGVVDECTWEAMGIDVPWTIDRWTTSSRVGDRASSETRIDAMIDFALEQEGSPYLWGGAGPYEHGYDCSGLALQAMRAAGHEPGISTVQHAAPEWLSTHSLEADPDYTRVPLEELRRGDWVFYTDAEGVIRHMVLYIGDGQMVDSYGPGVRKRPFTEQIGSDRFAIPMVLRVFP